MLKGKVLLVEDNEVNQLVAGAMLEHWQLQYIVAEDGKDAIEKWRDHQPDIILMDCQMPIMDGYEASRSIRKHEKNEQHVPIIALTANSTHGDREKCFAAGMDDYLSKPIKEDDMYNMLSKWLADKSGQTRLAGTQKGKTMSETKVTYLNKTVITNLQQFLNEEKLHTLMSRYLADSANIIEQLQHALASANQEESRRLVHSLKSTSANIGAMPLSELAKELEEFARKNALDEVSTRQETLRACFAQTQAAIDALDVMQKRKTG